MSTIWILRAVGAGRYQTKILQDLSDVHGMLFPLVGLTDPELGLSCRCMLLPCLSTLTKIANHLDLLKADKQDKDRDRMEYHQRLATVRVLSIFFNQSISLFVNPASTKQQTLQGSPSSVLQFMVNSVAAVPLPLCAVCCHAIYGRVFAGVLRAVPRRGWRCVQR